jgi:hypothetical protein
MRELDIEKFFKAAIGLWLVWAAVAITGGATLLYFVIQALNKYVNG